jgi:predicted small lipoprotein YifL
MYPSMKQDLKRRKTASDPDSLPDADVNGEIGSDEDTQTMRSKPGNGLRKPRVAPAQTQKEKDKELRDMKEKERERIEAAGRRKGRAERRNIEGQ